VFIYLITNSVTGTPADEPASVPDAVIAPVWEPTPDEVPTNAPDALMLPVSEPTPGIVPVSEPLPVSWRMPTSRACYPGAPSVDSFPAACGLLSAHPRSLGLLLGFRTKTGKSRVVPLERGLYDRLMLWREKNPTTKLIFGTSSDLPDTHYLEVCKETAKRANLTGNWYLHKLRSTFATWALRAGTDIRTVQAWMWTSVSSRS
jgi:hypothetical protein